MGEGGFGVVFAAAALPSLPRAGRCAVKRLVAAQQQAAWLELAREVQLLGTCSHPHLLPLLGFCLDPEAPCLVYPLMEGGSLEDRQPHRVIRARYRGPCDCSRPALAPHAG